MGLAIFHPHGRLSHTILYYAAKGLDGFSNWYEIQAREEQDHAMLFYHYLQNNSQAVTLKAIDKPDKTFAGLVEPLQAALAHEQ